MKRLALTKDGKITWCTATEASIGKGRCNHVCHQSDNQTNEEFLDSLKSSGVTDIEVNADASSNCDNLVEKIQQTKFYSSEASVPTVECKNGCLSIDKPFGLKDAPGVQLKGSIIIEEIDENGNKTSKFKYLKIDELNPSKGLDYTARKHDYLYPSVSEDICSKLIKSSDIGLNSVCYELHTIDMNGKKCTGTISDNFVEKGYYEKVLTSPNNPACIVDHNLFVEKVIDSDDKEQILESLISFYKKSSGEDIDDNSHDEFYKEFIIRQAAFDLMTGNEDRKENSTNFVYLRNAQGNIKPINLDYGRCIQSFWSQTMEDKKPSDELIQELADEEAEASLRKGGVFAPGIGGSLKESVDFLLDNGFKPFEINKQELYTNLDNFSNSLKGTNLEYYAKFKVALFKSMLNNDEIRRLWKEV